MYIIVAMAVSATAVDGFDLVQRHSVAVVTSDIDVSTLERKLGLCVVIESPNVPGNGIVAGLATILKIAVMRIIITVARYTGKVFFRERLSGVAIFALVLIVDAEQWEPSQVMIEKYRVLPIDFGVAACALRAQYTLVRIIIKVARVTARYQRDVENRIDMTVDAVYFPMSAEKPVVGMDVMVKERFRPLSAGMANVTLITSMFVMFIIFEMARRACLVHLVLKRLVRMTVATFQRGMFTFEGKFRVANVVKT
jgi:hypothetical protein